MPYTGEDINEIAVSDSDFTDDNKTVYLKYTVKCMGYEDHSEMNVPVKHVPKESVTMEVSFDGKEYAHDFSVDSKAGRWVGVKNGVFCTHDNTVKNEARGFVTVDSVVYTN